ncbi:MAG TPA: radical SAM protein [Syntrophomonadaceae bacterium]|nr:radical SAM protein [Syntrophomonadaceae bacterium]
MAEERLPGEVSSYGISYLPGPTAAELSRGCQSCKKGSWLSVRVGNRCNLSCSYCSRDRTESGGDLDDDFRINPKKTVSAIELKRLLLLPHGIEGISYTGGEPFLYVDKIVDMAAFVTQNLPSVYQWVYTNGLLPTFDTMKTLFVCGIQEIRFHIGASDFDERVINNIRIAVEIFPRVTVETPSTPQLYEYLILNEQIHLLAKIGVRQLNLPELYYRKEQVKTGNIPADSYTFAGGIRLVSPRDSHSITRAIVVCL